MTTLGAPKERGAEIVYEPVDQPYGYRDYSARDLEESSDVDAILAQVGVTPSDIPANLIGPLAGSH